MDVNAEPHPVDLAGYLRRVEYEGALEPTAEVLHALHLAHATHIPFENLDILLGRPIRLDLASLQAKLVHGGRGGYCFEQNALLAAVLEEVGFAVTRLSARVRSAPRRCRGRTCSCWCAATGGRGWPTGCSGGGLLHPCVADRRGERAVSPGATGRPEESGLWVLHRCMAKDGRISTRSAGAAARVDYEMANHFTSTHPESRFRRTVTAQLAARRRARVLRGGELVVDEGATVTRAHGRSRRAARGAR